MATVAVVIAGRTYRMACGEGEEGHLQDLARHVDATLATLRKGFGEIGDTRLVIMTAITVADELSEARRQIAALEERLAGLTRTTSEDEAMRDALASEVAVALEAAAARLEAAVRDLNETGRD